MNLKTNQVWWINPLKLLIGFIFPIYLLVFIIPFDNRGSSAYQVENYLNYESFFLGVLFFAFFSFGYLISFPNKSINAGTIQYISPKFLTVIGLITICSYLIWFNFLIFNPNILIDQLTGRSSPYYIRLNYQTIAGVTTLSQLGVLYVIIYAHNKSLEKITFKHKFIFILIIILTILRSFVWSERLALVEVSLPFGLLFINNLSKRRLKKRFTFVIKFLPFIGIVFLLFLFGFFEYFRSWAYYKQFYDNIFEFTVERVFTYYYGALNTGSAVLEFSNWPSLTLDSYLNWIYKFPFFGSYITELAPSEAYGNWERFLNRYLDPEFNNPSGIFKPYWDSGYIGAILYFMIWGCLVKFSYKEFRKGYGLGFYLYPVLFISVLECLRIPYLSNARVFPIFLFAFIGYKYFRKSLI